MKGIELPKDDKMKDKILSSAAKAGSRVAKNMVKRNDKSSVGHCEVADELFHESLDMYKSGAMSWDAMVKDLNKSLMSIDPKQDGSDDGENDGADEDED